MSNSKIHGVEAEVGPLIETNLRLLVPVPIPHLTLAVTTHEGPPSAAEVSSQIRSENINCYHHGR